MQMGRYCFRNRGDCFVPGGMSERVIIRFEMVNVKHEQMKQLKEKAASPDIGKQINHSEQEVEQEMKLFGLFGKREKEQPSPKPERAESLDDLDIYSGMRVEVTTFEGQLLFVAKLLGLHGQKAELRTDAGSSHADVQQLARFFAHLQTAEHSSCRVNVCSKA